MSRIGRAVAALLMAVACAVVPAGAATAGAATAVASDDVVACEIRYQTRSFPGGFGGNIEIHNTGTATIYGWTLIFQLLDGVDVVAYRNAEFVTLSGEITANSLPRNSEVAPGRYVSVGFVALGSAAEPPTTFTVNGVTCTVVT